jgi:hypothetical protein
MDHAARIVDRGMIFEAARSALAAERHLASISFGSGRQT